MARSAPSFSQARCFSALPTVQKTRAPKAWASWIAVVPMPLEPPWTRKVSPLARRPRSKTLVQTAKKVYGRAAAATAEKPDGMGSACGSGTMQYSA